MLGTMAVRFDVGSRSRGKCPYLKSTCVSGLAVHDGLVLRPIGVLENVGGNQKGINKYDNSHAKDLNSDKTGIGRYTENGEGIN